MVEQKIAQPFIPYGTQYVDQSDIRAVVKVLKGQWLTTGPTVDYFEKQIAHYVGARYAVAVSSATAGLHLAVLVLNISEGLEGITSPNTFLASANALIYNGLRPKFADIDEKTYNIDPQTIQKSLNKKTRVIIPVHFAGQPCDMRSIHRLTDNKNIAIIEDAAHALGSSYQNGDTVGSCRYSDMTVFSFHPVKTMTTGEGGIITTNSKKLYHQLKILRNHGMVKAGFRFYNPGPWYYEMQTLGFNYRLTDIQAALGISQFKKLSRFIQRRRTIVKLYNKAFSHLRWLKIPYERLDVHSAFHLYVVRINFRKLAKSRKQVVVELARQGIGTQVHYIPVHLQPYYRQHYGYKRGDYPRAEHYYEECLSLPLFPHLTNKQVNKIIRAVVNLSTL